MSLLLFDIDGTLLLSGGAGARAMSRAFDELFQIRLTFTTSDVAGRTDTFIVSNAFRRAGVPDNPEQHRRLRDAYVAILREEIAKPPAGHWGLMPGVATLLDQLRGDASVHIALLTGNFEPAARIKLGAFGIADHFGWGVFGEEAADRDELARMALRRAERYGVPHKIRERPVVIGDTPHDITCARAIGARALAVATGSFSVETLSAAGADVVFDTLVDTEKVLSQIRGGNAE